MELHFRSEQPNSPIIKVPNWVVYLAAAFLILLIIGHGYVQIRADREMSRCHHDVNAAGDVVEVCK